MMIRNTTYVSVPVGRSTGGTGTAAAILLVQATFLANPSVYAHGRVVWKDRSKALYAELAMLGLEHAVKA